MIFVNGGGELKSKLSGRPLALGELSFHFHFDYFVSWVCVGARSRAECAHTAVVTFVYVSFIRICISICICTCVFAAANFAVIVCATQTSSSSLSLLSNKWKYTHAYMEIFSYVDVGSLGSYLWILLIKYTVESDA